MTQNMIQAYFTQAFPKINISLKIGEKCGNLHTLQSRFCLVKGSLYDSILIANAPFDYRLTSQNDICHFETNQYNENVRFYLYGRFDCLLQDNLIYRAYCTLLKQASSRIKKSSLHILVSKKIPFGGGLGGGSVNAALALLILNEALELHYDIDTLLICAKTLGSDVAFFLMIYTQNKNSIDSYFFTTHTLQQQDLQKILTMFDTNGILCSDFTESLELKQKEDSIKFLSANVFDVGDKIEPFYENLPQFLIHCNTLACNTAAVYKEFARLKSNGWTNKNNIDLKQDSITLLQNHTMNELNDLYKPACNLYELEPIAKRLYSAYNNVYFSGSGGSFFSITQT